MALASFLKTYSRIAIQSFYSRSYYQQLAFGGQGLGIKPLAFVTFITTAISVFLFAYMLSTLTISPEITDPNPSRLQVTVSTLLRKFPTLTISNGTALLPEQTDGASFSISDPESGKVLFIIDPKAQPNSITAKDSTTLILFSKEAIVFRVAPDEYKTLSYKTLNWNNIEVDSKVLTESLSFYRDLLIFGFLPFFGFPILFVLMLGQHVFISMLLSIILTLLAVSLQVPVLKLSDYTRLSCVSAIPYVLLMEVFNTIAPLFENQAGFLHSAVLVRLGYMLFALHALTLIKPPDRSRKTI